MIPTHYKGSVKDLLGPIRVGEVSALIFSYSDAYSVFDWGRMPDLLPKKGEALAVLAADLFEKLEKPESWKDFSKSPEALALRKGNRAGSSFNEVGETLQAKGLRTHFLGYLNDGSTEPRPLHGARGPFKQIAVRQISVVKPTMTQVLGRSLPDYSPTRNSPVPRLVPLEVVFRFSCPPGSSLLARAAAQPGYLASIGFPDASLSAGAKWDFPLLELFTKLESTDRHLTLSEGLAISGLTGSQLQDLLMKTAWVAGYLKWLCARSGLELADGKLEWGVGANGEILLVDAIGPDEMRLLKGEVQLSKEFLRNHYRKTPWYESMSRAKEQAQAQGSADWKRLVKEQPPTLPTSHRELASQLYMSLTNQLTGRSWFPEAWSLSQVIQKISD